MTASGTSRHGSRGVTLIELMVSLVIGALLIAGAVTVYMQSRNTYRVNETAARLQEVARYALDTIEPDLRLAGYWGLTYHQPDVVLNSGTAGGAEEAVAAGIEDDCGNNWIVDADLFIDARDSSDTAGSGYDLACESEGDPASWGDVLIIRRASADVKALDANRIQVQSSRTAVRFINDGALPPDFGATSSETRDLIVHAYYVRENAPSSNGLPQFELRRQTLVGKAILDQQVVPGVEDLQVQFGIDGPDTDQNADRYVTPEAVPANARVVSVRLWILVVAEDAEVGFSDDTSYAYANANYGTFDDHRRRVLISKTIHLRDSLL